eukprot:TRINITY_DN15781_c0_g1_i1.p1 TRINITY_DN15781_c0_g1~~TRINITY_DN15781_c0_g1_i1.p1  ORF type:complete len:1136 (-),score=238.54 TRINITY_DN15781_c0_g1_i1:93-3500(-)
MERGSRRPSGPGSGSAVARAQEAADRAEQALLEATICATAGAERALLGGGLSGSAPDLSQPVAAAERPGSSSLLARPRTSDSEPLGRRPSSHADNRQSTAATETSRASTPFASTSLRAGSSSAASLKMGSGRFSQDELRGFRRVQTILATAQRSVDCDQAKSESYFRMGVSATRSKYSERGLNNLPCLKGCFYTNRRAKSWTATTEEASKRGRQSRKMSGEDNAGKKMRKLKEMLLPQEALTAMVLNEIYPRTPIRKDDPGSPLLGTDAATEEAGRVGEESPDRKAPMVSFDGERSGELRLSESALQGESGGGMASRKHPPQLGDVGTPSCSSPPTRSVRASIVNLGISIPDGSSASRGGGGGMSVTATPSAASRSVPATPSSTKRSKKIIVNTFGASQTGNTQDDMTEEDIKARNQAALLDFREMILEKFTSVSEAFETFAHELPRNTSDLSKKDWKKMLLKHHFEWPTREHRDAVFANLDFAKDRRVPVMEFHIAVEAAAPVRTIEDLRRRWLASGYNSMSQAIAIMDDNGATTRRRLALWEFGELLCRVNVFGQDEHSALFTLVCTDKTGRVSVAELASAVSMVSPMLLLEDIRARIMALYKGDYEKAFRDMDNDKSDCLSRNEFLKVSQEKFHIVEVESQKFFRALDLDGCGEISRANFARALTLSDPSLLLEDLRLKIRQRWRSIERSLMYAFQDVLAAFPDREPQLNLKQFRKILCDVEMRELEANVLFELMDANQDDSLTVKEVTNGLRHFAPSTVLESLRLACCERFEDMHQVLEEKQIDTAQTLDFAGFVEVLKHLELDVDVDIQDVFDLIDVKHDGAGSMGRLLAAMKAVGPGAHIRLTAEEQQTKAKREVRSELLPVQRLVGDIKTLVRLGNSPDLDTSKAASESGPVGEDYKSGNLNQLFAMKRGGSVSAAQTAVMASGSVKKQAPSTTPSGKGAQAVGGASRSPGGADANAEPMAGSAGGPGAPPTPGSGSTSGEGNGDEEDADGPKMMVRSASLPGDGRAPMIRTMPLEMLGDWATPLPAKVPLKPSQKSPGDCQSTFEQVYHRLGRGNGKETVEILPNGRSVKKELHGYFQDAAWHLSHDVPLHNHMQSRYDVHQKCQAHLDALKPGWMRAATLRGVSGF